MDGDILAIAAIALLLGGFLMGIGVGHYVGRNARKPQPTEPSQEIYIDQATFDALWDRVEKLELTKADLARQCRVLLASVAELKKQVE